MEYFPGITTLQLCGKVTDLLSRLGEAPETFTGRILCMSMFNDISCDNKGNEEQCVVNSKVVSILAKKFGDSGHLLVQLLRRNGILGKRIVHKEFGIISRKRCCWNSLKAFPCNDSIVQEYAQKQRTRKTVDSLCCRPRNN